MKKRIFVSMVLVFVLMFGAVTFAAPKATPAAKAAPTLYRIFEKHSYGYMDNTGKVVIPCKYFSAQEFSDGVAAVNQKTADGRNGPWSLIDTTGKIVANLDKTITYVQPFKEGLAEITVSIPGEEFPIQLHGFIDTKGKIVIKPTFDACQVNFGPYGSAYNFEFSEGLSRINKNYQWGFIDKNGKVVIPLKYYCVSDFSDGLAVAVSNRDSDSFSVINKTGKEVFRVKSQYDFDSKVTFKEGFLAFTGSDAEGNKTGYVNKTGKVVIKPQFDKGLSFTEGLAAVYSQKEQKWGFVDKTGKLVIPYKYAKANGFYEGLAYVEVEKGKDVTEGGFIDKKGVMVIKSLMSTEYPLDMRFKNGLAEVMVPSTKLASGKVLFKYAYVDPKGKRVWEAKE